MMSADYLTRMRQELKKEKERDIKLIHQAYEARLRAISVLEKFRAPDDDEGLVPGAAPQRATRSRVANLSESVRQVLPDPETEFTLDDVFQALLASRPDLQGRLTKASVSNSLIRLSKDPASGVVTLRKGSGSSPTVYRREM